MSNCICGANNLYKLFEYCHLAESILFPIHVYCKHRLNKYNSWLNFKMKTPKKYSSKSSQKSAFSHVLPFKHQRENKVFQNKESQFTTRKFKTSASFILSHILAIKHFPPAPTWPSVGSFSTQWVFMLGFLMFGKGQMSCSATLMILFTHSDHQSDAYLLYLTFE